MERATPILWAHTHPKDKEFCSAFFIIQSTDEADKANVELVEKDVCFLARNYGEQAADQKP